jgi:excisionase family DNA binding protein
LKKAPYLCGAFFWKQGKGLTRGGFGYKRIQVIICRNQKEYSRTSEENRMPEDMMSTKEIAHYLGIHEKQVYALIKEKKIPATRVTGKWIFPKKIIDEWIESSAKRGVREAREKSRRIEGGLLASGSNDPILDMLQTHMKKEHPEFYIFSANTGSTEGLKILN